ncbi:hypothetical protein D9615_000360 [Tricholomella constricta]|uniref:HMG box domain-containing protein n=1 Tax=Tricholomella constricta TaxID=117010 RepID=A0A8H5HRQ6_9AGAR|nr:hypothetical protein D9615_000360 [Tricholomella constricta]
MRTNSPMKQEESDPAPYSRLYTISPYPSPSKSKGSPFGEWSFSSAASCTIDPSPQFQHTLYYGASSSRHDIQSTPMVYHHANNDLSTALRIDHSSLSPDPMYSSSSQKPPRTHVPRPPNAFMLYRSDFLKRGVIPSHVERRQQNLSRIAGQCWNLLPAEEKVQWQERAAQVLVEHQKRNPDYKFTPAPRGSRRQKAKGRLNGDGEAVEGEDRIRQIREEYTRIAGPTASPARRRRPRAQNRSRNLDQEPMRESPLSQAAATPLPPSISPSPSPSLTSPGNDSNEAPLPPFFPQYSFPHIVPPRRPSTSLGFATASTSQENGSVRSGLNLTRPSSAASETGLTNYLKDLDITPTAATFPRLSSSASPTTSVQNSYPNSQLYLPEVSAQHDETSYPSLNIPFSGMSFMEKDSELESSPNSDSFLSTLYSSEPFTFSLPPLPAPQEYSPLGDSYLFDHMAPSAFQEGWDLETSFGDAAKSYIL